jgi:hypothetical protein
VCVKLVCVCSRVFCVGSLVREECDDLNKFFFFFFYLALLGPLSLSLVETTRMYRWEDSPSVVVVLLKVGGSKKLGHVDVKNVAFTTSVGDTIAMADTPKISIIN